MNRLALKIKEARLAKGLTEKELAKKCGLSVGYILQVESGKKIVNESVAEKILKALGSKEELMMEEKEPETPIKAKHEQKAPVHEIIAQPSQSWEGALAGVIKKYTITDIQSGKESGYKELPIIGKKIEGYHPDKIMFVRCSSGDMARFRIEKGDVLTVIFAKEIQNDGIYLVELDGKRLIRQLRRETSGMIRLATRSNDSEALVVEMKRVKLIGKVIKNEFEI